MKTLAHYSASLFSFALLSLLSTDSVAQTWINKQWVSRYSASNNFDEIRGLTFRNNFLCATGRTKSLSFLTQPQGAYYFTNTLSGQEDAFVTVFNSNLSLHWSTYLGGLISNTSETTWGSSLVMDLNNNLYIAGRTSSISFPSRCPSIPSYCQPTYSNFTDGFISRFKNIGSFTGLQETTQIDEELIIYPNPSNGNITIQIQIFSPSPLEISIYNLLGQLLYSYYNVNVTGLFQKDIELKDVTWGINICNVKVGDRVMSKKLIFQH